MPVARQCDGVTRDDPCRYALVGQLYGVMRSGHADRLNLQAIQAFCPVVNFSPFSNVPLCPTLAHVILNRNVWYCFLQMDHFVVP